MFYKPKLGGIWDPSVIHYHGKYYMTSMYFDDKRDGVRMDDYMWVAESDDGVHWHDLGPVLLDRKGVCKMYPYLVGEDMYVNFGSFSAPDKRHNDTLRYYKSNDMIHWTYVGEDHPDGQWYHTEGRWDHMYVYPEGGIYYGYPVATPLPEHKSAWGLCKSTDGATWTCCPPPVIEWGDIPPINCLEGGGMEKIGDKYYYIGGFVGYANNYGYALYTFVADSPEGPFRPDRGAFRLCGFDRLEGRVFVQNLAAFARGKDGELLITNAVDAGGQYEIWLLPFRRAVVDDEGHLRLGYWPGNDAVRGREIPLDAHSIRVTYAACPDGSDQPAHVLVSRMTPTEHGFSANTNAFTGPVVTDNRMMLTLEGDYDLETGVILEGTVEATTYPAYDEHNHRTNLWRPATFGLFSGEQLPGSDSQAGLAITLGIGHPYKRCSFVESFTADEHRMENTIVDTIGEDCANVRGMSAGEPHTFRFLCRRNMLELYLDDLHVQTFVNLRPTSGKLGFVLQNAAVNITDLHLYEMNLS